MFGGGGLGGGLGGGGLGGGLGGGGLGGFGGGLGGVGLGGGAYLEIVAISHKPKRRDPGGAAPY